MKGNGAFKLDNNKTVYFGIVSSFDIFKDLKVRFNYYEGETILEDSRTIINEVSAKSRSYSIDVSKKLCAQSKLKVSYIVPFYVYKGRAVVNITTSVTTLGNVVSKRVSNNYSYFTRVY